jgi:hypothetical protein
MSSSVEHPALQVTRILGDTGSQVAERQRDVERAVLPIVPIDVRRYGP